MLIAPRSMTAAAISLLTILLHILAPNLVFGVLLTPGSGSGSGSGSTSTSEGHEGQKLHIVYLGALPKASTFESTVSSHVQLLSLVKKSEEAGRGSLVVNYYKSFNGFAAMLTPKEVKALKEMSGVVSVFKSQKKQLHTTRSWDFLGLTSSSPRSPTVESNLIVGMLDTGIWPENPMFNDRGFGPIPSSWKGECTTGDHFSKKNCNRKLIGAKYFKKGMEAEIGHPLDNTTDFISARDNNGHGSHTASTAAGSIAKGASLYGLAKGDARGAVPAARLAVYKVCWLGGSCTDSDILAGFDEAVHDGVDFLSVSLGGPFPVDYAQDSIAIGAFHAMQKGIVVICAAGNAGAPFSDVNVAPWIITVAASTIDRHFYSPVTLGNNVTLKGTAINTFSSPQDPFYPLITGTQAEYANSSYEGGYCGDGVLDPNKVKGKILYCDQGGDDVSVLQASGKGAIFLTGDVESDVAFAYVLPTSFLVTSDGEKVSEYINTTSNPVAKIMPCEVSTNEFAPLVAFFSSRGPNAISPSIMKPDLSAPGVDIIAAWSRNDSVTENPPGIDNRFPDYNIISGTSMATPHVTGAAAYVKSMHPDWSPAAIKSALMTTALPFDPTKEANSDQEFGYGSGQINPTKAVDPGLIYDAGYVDYVLFLCAQGYNSTEMALITGDASVKCPPTHTSKAVDLNYPAVTGAFRTDLKGKWYITTRTLTNVGNPADLTYTAILDVPAGMDVRVTPTTLHFTSPNEKQSFQVALRAPGLNYTLSASLVWTSEIYSIRTPIVAYILDA